jgi:2-polyprenyl-3-methyl-5-hydroxy-6-metoxy-1,4-benzoquinol methylase
MSQVAAGPKPGDTRAAVERFVRWTIDTEFPAHASFLPEGEREAFAAYYASLPRRGDEARIRRHLRGLWRGDTGWTIRWLAERAARGTRPVVMDAGSGFGSFSMLYAVAGAEVIGADLRPDRLEASKRRLEFHRTSTGESLPVRYERADLTRAWSSTVDLVWVYNALSHIEPLDAFLQAVRDHLRPGGVIVVGDINGAHPAHVQRLDRLRTEVSQQYTAPDGETHAYAVERTFPPREMRRVMQANGLRMVHHELYWGGLGVLPDPLYEGLMRPLQDLWWFGHGIARRQMAVATRA